MGTRDHYYTLRDIARTVDFELARTMRNWVLASSGAPLRALRLDAGVRAEGHREAGLIVLYGEARDTQRALENMEPALASAVRHYWTYEGEALRWHARRLRIKVETFTRRVCHGHRVLRRELAYARASREERRAAYLAGRSGKVNH